MTVDLVAGTADGNASVGHDTIQGGVVGVYGTEFADTIKGNAQADRLWGNGGNDTLTGRGGDDHLTGGTGNDAFVFSLGDGHDIIADFVSGQDKVDLTVGLNLAGLQNLVAAQANFSTFTFSDGSSVYFAGLTLSQLNLQNDFIFALTRQVAPSALKFKVFSVSGWGVWGICFSSCRCHKLRWHERC